MCFPVSIAKFLRAAFSVEHLWLVLYKTPVAASEIPLDTLVKSVLKQCVEVEGS